MEVEEGLFLNIHIICSLFQNLYMKGRAIISSCFLPHVCSTLREANYFVWPVQLLESTWYDVKDTWLWCKGQNISLSSRFKRSQPILSHLRSEEYEHLITWRLSGVSTYFYMICSILRPNKTSRPSEKLFKSFVRHDNQT